MSERMFPERMQEWPVTARRATLRAFEMRSGVGVPDVVFRRLESICGAFEQLRPCACG